MFLLTLLNFWSYRRVLGPTDGAASSGVAEHFTGHDIMEDLEKDTQMALEEVFNRDGKAVPEVHNLDEITYTEGEDKANEHPKVTKQDAEDVTNAGDQGYINHIHVMEGEDRDTAVDPPALEFRL
ncbi:hypothetical protein ElyMa_000368400 [Elysia marginata]|uniref:Uncharacterized protein n=1 Tax=Elysia marginata TaxID=1093978 RepID=A0AAV4FI46_9GAST|nr:hypothetical protein ElyMa_000368400 [Elysia marginata]